VPVYPPLSGYYPTFLRLRQQATSNTGTPYIAGASSDGTYFVDQNGAPRVWFGDIPWAILGNGGAWNSGDYQTTFTNYFSQRAAQGYTVCEVSWASFSGGSAAFVHADGSDWDAAFPFSSTTNPSTTPNATFWARRDALFTTALKYGITVVCNITTVCLSAGSPDTAPQTAWTTQQWTDYGTFLGNRYKGQPNIMWIVGDDYFGGVDTGLNAMRTAMRTAGDTHLWSIQNYQETTSRQDLSTLGKDPNSFDVHADFEWCYSYNVSYDVAERAQLYTPTGSDDHQGVVPGGWMDGFFLASGVSAGQSDTRLERQMIWWALSSGAAGVNTGDNDVWVWVSTSAAQVTGKTFYSSTMPAIINTYKALPNWWQLAPDTSSVLVTAGRGSHASAITSGGGGTPYTANTDTYVTASRTPDTGSGSTLAVIYSGKALNITVDQTKMRSGYTATWVDPLTGATTAGTPGSTYNSATAVGNNSAGDPDWVLILRG
jgi:hypothetical protein